MKNEMLNKIEKEVLPKLTNYVDTNKKVGKLTFTIFRGFFKSQVSNDEFEIRDEIVSPQTEDDFYIIGILLLYIVQNPDNRGVDEMLAAQGFEEMLDNILSC